MKSCELCSSSARIYCESDQASLCWNCDSKVHGANFIVARHCRSLLCYTCQSPTPWKASGAEFGPTVSVCRLCVADRAEKNRREDACEESQGGNEVEIDSEEISDRDDDDEDRDTQVVPLSSPPPATSSSSGASPIPSLKRSREISSDPRFHEDDEVVSKRRDTGSAVAVALPRSRW